MQTYLAIFLVTTIGVVWGAAKQQSENVAATPLAQVCGKAMKLCVLVPVIESHKYPTRKALLHTCAREDFGFMKSILLMKSWVLADFMSNC